MTPERFGPFRVVRRLGAGGMGEVFLAHQESAGGVGRPCVVKTIKKSGPDKGAQARFVHEAQVAMQLSHKNICHVIDVGEEKSGFFLAMDYIAGRDLRAVLQALHERGHRLTPALGLYIVRELLEGLDYAHRAVDAATGRPLDIVHRDLTPSNVMISLEGEVKIIDFGASASRMKSEWTAVGTVHGKLGYLSPEQARGEALDGRSDLYAAAIVATELLSGAGYYGGMDRAQMLDVVPKGWRSPLLDSLDADIRDVLVASLAPNRDDRTATAEEMRARVERLLVSRQLVVGPADLRRLMADLFPDELKRQRELVASASSPPAASDSASSSSTVELTELVSTRKRAHADAAVVDAGGSRTQPIARTHTGTRVAAAAAAVVLVAVVVFAAWKAMQGPPPPVEDAVVVADAGSGPPVPVVVVDEGGGGAVADAGVEVEPEPLPATAAAHPKRPTAKLVTIAEKIRFIEGCGSKQRCAPKVRASYANFAKLSLDETRRLTGELDACVKKCGGNI